MLCSIGGVERGPRRRELAATAISCLPSRQSAIFHEPPYRPAMMALGWGFYRYSANVLPVRRTICHSDQSISLRRQVLVISKLNVAWPPS